MTLVVNRILYLFFLLIGQSTIWACSAAYQYSLFPLGKSLEKLYVLELELERYLKTPDNPFMQMGGSNPMTSTNELEVRWKGSVRVQCMIDSDVTLFKDLGFIDISDQNYQDALGPYFDQAVELTEKLPFFTAAQVMIEGLCYYDRSCRLFSSKIDTNQLNMYCFSALDSLETQYNQLYFPPKIYQKLETQTKTKFTAFRTLDRQIQHDFYRIWSPFSIRYYQIEDEVIAVYTYGKGDKSKYTKTANASFSLPHSPYISDNIKGNDVLFHGQRFDCLFVKQHPLKSK